jgi:hypothetical protein
MGQLDIAAYAKRAHPVVVSVKAEQVLVVLLLLAAGAGQAVLPCKPPDNAVLLDPENSMGLGAVPPMR